MAAARRSLAFVNLALIGRRAPVGIMTVLSHLARKERDPRRCLESNRGEKGS